LSAAAFDDVWVVDSSSRDDTCGIALQHGVRIEDYIWNGKYPKKRGWCLEYLELAHDWVFFVDADEIVTLELLREVEALDLEHDERAGYFVRGRYVWHGRSLRHGLSNNKLALFNRRKIEFPVVDDLGLPGMEEIEGHYQPVLKAGFEAAEIGQLDAALAHDIGTGWNARHLRYAMWEAGMNARGSWPMDPKPWREFLKRVFRRLPFRGAVAFVHCYVLKRGFMDGAAGFDFARSRARYYRMISDASKDLAQLS
jgi:glycosyltransferase involved in cell wall biosynthesis